jgi:hypothetical protein
VRLEAVEKEIPAVNRTQLPWRCITLLSHSTYLAIRTVSNKAGENYVFTVKYEGRFLLCVMPIHDYLFSFSQIPWFGVIR